MNEPYMKSVYHDRPGESSPEYKGCYVNGLNPGVSLCLRLHCLIFIRYASDYDSDSDCDSNTDFDSDFNTCDY